MITGATYESTRLGLQLSRVRVSAMSKRAGHFMTESAIKRLEVEGSRLAGSRNYPATTLAWLEYVLGISDPTDAVDWAAVEKGAPVLVHGEKMLYSFQAIADGGITLWGGPRSREAYRTLPLDAIRLVATTATPPPEIAYLYPSSKGNGVDSAYGKRILEYMNAHPGPQSVGGMAYTLGIDNMAVSRVAAVLVKRGQLVKIQRGVYVVTEPTEIDLEAASVKTALAERVMAPR